MTASLDRADPAAQRRRLTAALPPALAFNAPLRRAAALRVLQINLGRLCNMRCSHCHVDAGPHQGASQMTDAVVDDCLAAIERLRPAVVDLTGGAPELHPRFRDLVRQARRLDCHVIDRCNLTVLLLPTLDDLAGWLAAQGVEVVASLPADDPDATDAQRGEGTWAASLEALRRLNAVGYGHGDPAKPLTLMSNPSGATVQRLTPCDEQRWRQRLATEGLRFDRLIGLTNMPIARFLEQLEATGSTDRYLALLQQQHNPASLCGLMCRDTLSVAADGSLHDCDFNQMLDLPLGRPATIATVTIDDLAGQAIRTGNHCYGCTAGQGSSCAGATSPAAAGDVMHDPVVGEPAP
ncbi:MAG: arsenosugar biosynthesis radical SAM protein ArsS [Synechococcus sp. Tobar2m-G35]|nr:arsenosugar biosynthesis radical SAM protein ArsS [Synechococcus sp. Tobar2m-G35]